MKLANSWVVHDEWGRHFGPSFEKTTSLGLNFPIGAKLSKRYRLEIILTLVVSRAQFQLLLDLVEKIAQLLG
jgi:hypothetical protein